MDSNHRTALPSLEGTAPTSIEKPENSESDIEIQKLLSEICSLSESGRDPARLWHLKQTRDKHYLQEINKALALFPKPDQSGWPEFQEMEQARLQSHQVAISRTDLTVPVAKMSTTVDNFSRGPLSTVVDISAQKGARLGRWFQEIWRSDRLSRARTKGKL